jgi:hypothetical protein
VPGSASHVIATPWMLQLPHEPEVAHGRHIHRVAGSREGAIITEDPAGQRVRILRDHERPGLVRGVAAWGVTLFAGGPVDEFARDVQVADVTRVLLQQVKQDAAERRCGAGRGEAAAELRGIGQRGRGA